MCGTPLEARRAAPTPVVASSQDAVHAGDSLRENLAGNRGDNKRFEPQRTPVPANMRPQPEHPAGTIAGPSLLGLNPSLDPMANVDELRDRTRHAEMLAEPDEANGGRHRVLLLLGLLIALCAAGWWTYNNYLGATGAAARRAASNQPSPATPPETATAQPDASQPSSSANPPQSGQPAAPAQSPTAQSATPSAPTQASSGPTTSTTEISTPTTSASATQPNSAPAAPPVSPRAAKPSTDRRSAERSVIAAPKPAAKVTAEAVKPARSKTVLEPAPAPGADTDIGDKGDADYRKAEAFLYGRGATENCDQAVKYLKSASAKQNAKARSMFGTMYATGHCVARDLPTSYGWFALALHVDPNNQILEKDLTAVWNQMTPPERELATKFKP